MLRHSCRVLLHSGNERPRHPARSARGGAGARPAAANKRQRLPPGRPELDDKRAARRQQRRHRRGNRPIAIESVGSAIERARGSKSRTSGGKRRDIAGGNIGRVGNDQVERSAQRGRHVAGDEAARVSPSAGHCRARCASAAELDVGADAEGVRQLGQSSASRIAPEPVPRSAMRSGRERGPLRVDCGERRFDDRFGLRPRHQRRGVDAQSQAPEFLDCRQCARPARAARRRAPARRSRLLPRCRGGARAPPRAQRDRGRSAWPTRIRASSSGESMAPARNSSAQISPRARQS